MFEKPQQNINDLILSGSKLLLAIYGAPQKIMKKLHDKNLHLEKCSKILQDFKYSSFVKATSNKQRKTAVKLESLIPTFNGFEQHVKRVYLQTQIWMYGNQTFDYNSDDDDDGNAVDNITFDEKSQQANFLSPFKWGWTYDSEQLVPIKMTEKPAPQDLLDIIFCSCKTGCPLQCGCRKAELECTPACINCYNKNCSNSPLPIHEEELENKNNVVESGRETDNEDIVNDE